MDKSLESQLKKTQAVSRAALYGSILLMLSNIFYTHTGNTLLFRILTVLGVTLFILYWMMPVFFLLARKQALAITWSRGLGRWEKIKNADFNNIHRAEKLLMYMNFMLSCVVLLIFFLFVYYITSTEYATYSLSH